MLRANAATKQIPCHALWRLREKMRRRTSAARVHPLRATNAHGRSPPTLSRRVWQGEGKKTA